MKFVSSPALLAILNDNNAEYVVKDGVVELIKCELEVFHILEQNKIYPIS